MNFSLVFVHLLWLSFFIGICSSKIPCIPSEREALLRFKDHLTDSSNRLSTWNNASNSNCCHWVGVLCDHVTGHILQLHLNTSEPILDDYVSFYEYFEALDAYERSMFGGEVNPSLLDLKHLNHLDLSGNYFRGTQFPSFLVAMTSLTYLNLSDAGFNGTIPHQIGNLSNLLYLDLSYAANGVIPYQIGNLTNLLYLDLSHTANGAIPYQIGNLTNLLRLGLQSEYLFAENLHWLSSLSSLQYLDLGYANLSKSFDWLQTMQALPSLTELHLRGCTLSHYDHPSSINFSSLVSLDLSATLYHPKWIFGLRKLVSLQLSLNAIQGPIPDGIQNLTLLENLDLSFNSFASSIPDWLYCLHHLKFLNLGYNKLHGTISEALGNLTSLIKLDLSRNQLEGRIPTSLGNLCNLREIDFSNLKLNQQVNEILEILTSCVSHGLMGLKIRNSQLSGNLTDQIEVFKNLVYLDFSNNSIHGVLPRPFGKLSSLKFLDLSNNQFHGNPFEVLGSLSKLYFLSIDDNLFQGPVKDDDLANLTRLKEFQASRNNLTLKVGPNWHPTFQVVALGMSSWQLGPNLPSWIQSQKDLEYLDMSNTGISDTIPTWLWETFQVDAYLNLSHNHIHGELGNTLTKPMSFDIIDLSSNHLSGKLSYLLNEERWVDFSNNSFSGSMIDFLCKKQGEPLQVELLNLASNNLSGEIPDCWIMWPNLADVNLQSNHFIGKLPQSMGSLALLESLNICNNKLFGEFPPSLKNNSELISLDLGDNRLTGIIPTWIGERLLNLKILRLRSNNFLGQIPIQMCAMSHLQVLDLAQNSLSGIIPSCFNNLSSMTQKNKSEDSRIIINVDLSQSIVSVFLWLKGRGDEYRSILGLVTSIDLSNNKLSGGIPRGVTNLDGLNFLNLSHNQLTGHVPPTIGSMGSIQTIDFSFNELSGEIPQTITNLSFLSMLDLSYNHLKGKIPTGTQIQTFEASNFVGNNLCGPPLPINCSSHGQINDDEDHNDKERDGHGVNWFFVSMAFGFIVGFWVVVAPLFIYRSWRYAYFNFLDDMWYKIQSCW